MKVIIDLNKIKSRYSNEIANVMSQLAVSTSKNKSATEDKLKWAFVYGHRIDGCSFMEIMLGKVKPGDNPNDFKTPQERAAAWIKRIETVSLCGSIGNWRRFIKLNEIPQEVKDYELFCAIKAVKRELDNKPLTNKQVDILVKNGLVLM